MDYTYYCSCYKFLHLSLNGSFTPRPLPPQVNMPTPKRWAQTQVSLQSLATRCGKLLDRWAVGPLGRWGTQAEQTAFLRLR